MSSTSGWLVVKLLAIFFSTVVLPPLAARRSTPLPCLGSDDVNEASSNFLWVKFQMEAFIGIDGVRSRSPVA